MVTEGTTVWLLLSMLSLYSASTRVLQPAEDAAKQVWFRSAEAGVSWYLDGDLRADSVPGETIRLVTTGGPHQIEARLNDRLAGEENIDFGADLGEVLFLDFENGRVTGRAHLLVQPALYWTRSDNGTDIDWPTASAYCQGLERAGLTDWRLPAPEELAEIYDGTHRVRTWSYQGQAHSVMMKKGFEVTAAWFWSSRRLPSQKALGYFFAFFNGGLDSSPLLSRINLRALCVHDRAVD